MYGKLIIKGEIEVITGLHIGDSDVFTAIGAIANPIIKDKLTGLPIIPGSSIKGKMRTLLARSLSNDVKLKKIDEDGYEIKRLFGKGGKDVVKARLQFMDCFLSDNNIVSKMELTEVKFENVIKRGNASAIPRQVERVIKGSIFDFTLVYDVENQSQIKKDFTNIAQAMKLLQLDYLGGNGTRGHGRVAFKKLQVSEMKIGDTVDGEIIKAINSLLKDVENYGILSI